MRIGILTGGGDCPGLNAVIRAITRRSLDRGDEVVGHPAWLARVWSTGQTAAGAAATSRGILPRGGTIIRTSRTNPYKVEGGVERVLRTMESLDALVAIGGEDTLGVAARLHAEHGARVVGVPKTIDNDLNATDVTFGFDTAVSIATEAVDRLHSTAESHDRVMVCEVMGRHAGWIALHSGIAGGADVILIPEQPVSVEACCSYISRRHGRGKDFSIVVVSEGWPLTFDSGEAQSRRIGRPRCVRPRPAGRDRKRAGRRDPGAYRVRDPRHLARARPAGRLADGLRPRAGHPVRP